MELQNFKDFNSTRLFETESSQRALFLDLDHTIIKPKSGKTFPEDIDDWEFIDGVLESIEEYAKKNFKVLIVSNQGGIAVGHATEDETNMKFQSIIKEANKNGVIINDYIFAKTNNSTDKMRKPNPGMAHYFAKKYNLNLSESAMVGDMITDEEFADNSNIGNYIDINNFKKK